jgi:hypothetical protein
MAKITKYLEQIDNDLMTKLPCELTIPMSNYRLNDNLKINEAEENIWVSSLLSQIEYSDIVFNLILDYSIEIQIKNMEVYPKEKIVLKYDKGDMILTAPFETVEIKKQVSFGERLLGGREVYKNPEHILKRMMDVYGGSVSDLDLVHL